MSDQYLTIHGILNEIYASLKNSRPKDEPAKDPQNLHGKKVKDDAHESATDPQVTH